MKQRAISSPVGLLLALSKGGKLVSLQFNAVSKACDPCPILDQIEKELRLYFKGELKRFSTPFFFEGTEFQERVWWALLDIPYGECITYKELADKVGCSKGARAVGSAARANRLPILLPCHRVVRKGGMLGGFAGGIERKEILLNLEKSD